MAEENLNEEFICKRLVEVGNDLMEAALNKTIDTDLVQQLSSLCQAVKRSIQDGLFSQEATALSSTIANNMLTIINNTRNVERVIQEVRTSVEEGIDTLFNRLSLEDRCGSRPPSSRDTTPIENSSPNSLPSILADDSHPIQLPQAHKWVIKHIQNPYPSNNVKSKLAERAGLPLKSINVWFVNHRQRIGWTSISKRLFAGSRAETVDCANRVFVCPDPKRPVAENIQAEFFAVKETAIQLYQSNFDKSDTLMRLNRLEKDLQCAPPRASSSGSSVIDTSFKPQHSRKRGADQALGTNSRKRIRTESPTLELTVSSSHGHSQAQPRPIKRQRSAASSFYTSSSSRSSQESSSEPATPPPPCSLSLMNWLNGIPDQGFEPVDPVADLYLDPTVDETRPRKRKCPESDNLKLTTYGLDRTIPEPISHTTYPEAELGNGRLDELLATIDFTIPPAASIGGELPPGDFDLGWFDEWSNWMSSPLAPVNVQYPIPTIPLQPPQPPPVVDLFDQPELLQTVLPELQAPTTLSPLDANGLQLYGLPAFDTRGFPEKTALHTPLQRAATDPEQIAKQER